MVKVSVLQQYMEEWRHSTVTPLPLFLLDSSQHSSEIYCGKQKKHRELHINALIKAILELLHNSAIRIYGGEAIASYKNLLSDKTV